MEHFLHIIFTTRTRDCVLSEGQPGKTLRSKFIRSNYCSQSRLSFNEKVPGLPALQIVIEKQAACCLYSGKCCRPCEGRSVSHSQCDTSCSSKFLKSYIYITFVQSNITGLTLTCSDTSNIIEHYPPLTYIMQHYLPVVMILAASPRSHVLEALSPCSQAYCFSTELDKLVFDSKEKREELPCDQELWQIHYAYLTYWQVPL